MQLEHRARLGGLSERVAARYLIRQGGRVLGRNLRVGRGEIDLLFDFGGVRTVVEVRSTTGGEPPHLRFDGRKAAQVRSLARKIGATRVDVVAIRYTAEGAEIHWLPDVA